MLFEFCNFCVILFINYQPSVPLIINETIQKSICDLYFDFFMFNVNVTQRTARIGK